MKSTKFINKNGNNEIVFYDEEKVIKKLPIYNQNLANAIVDENQQQINETLFDINQNVTNSLQNDTVKASKFFITGLKKIFSKINSFFPKSLQNTIDPVAKTSEFWVSLFGILVIILQPFGLHLSPSVFILLKFTNPLDNVKIAEITAIIVPFSVLLI